MDTFRQDLRYAFRQLGRNPGFSLAAASTIALGIGVTTIIFSLANAVLLRPLPVHEPNRLVEVLELRADGQPRSSLPYPSFQEYREAGEGTVRLGAFGFGEVAFQGEAYAEVLSATYVSGDYFELLGLSPVRGRFFSADEERAGTPAAVAVISHALWQQEFGGDPEVVGSTMVLNSRPLTVVGVAPEGFGGVMTGLASDVWVPIPMYAELNPGSEIYTPGRESWLVMFGRLAPGVGLPAVEARLADVARAIDERSAGPSRSAGVLARRYGGIPGQGAGSIRLFLGLLFATAALVLLIACVNVAGMLLARATTRGREVGIRLALGAGRCRLVRQLLTESTVLFLLGGAGGLLLAVLLSDLVVQLPAGLPLELQVDVSPDARVIGFGLLLALLTGIVFGLLPALRASRPAVASALREGGFATEGRSRLRGAFVTGQIGLSVLLLVTAGLLVRSLQSSLAVDPGMDTAGVVVASLNLAPHGYDAEQVRFFYEQYMDRLAERPGVQAVSVAHRIPLTFSEIVERVEVPGHVAPEGADGFLIDYNVAGPGYFSTLGIALEGRGFTRGDGPEAPAVAIVNRTMAERFWGGDAIGERIAVAGEEREIVGVAADGRYGSLHEDPTPYLYLPFGQESEAQMTVLVRSSEPFGAVAAMMREELRVLDPNVPLVAPASLGDRIRISIFPQKFGAVLIGAFGILGLVLAAVGLYGILAFAVSRRTREFGVRIALGARGEDVLRLVLRDGVVLVAVGLACGLVLSLAATRLLGGLIVGVTPTDPPTFLVVSLLLTATTLLASYLPARRATKVDPMIALRSD